MILLNDVIHILTGASFAFLRKQLFSFEVTHSSDVSRILVDIGIPLVLEQKMDIGSPSDVLMASFSVAAVLVHRAQVLP